MTKISNAIILAAGRGVRMGSRGKVIPKGLIEVAGKQLVVRSLEILFDAGIEQVTIVTGHLAEAFAPAMHRFGRRLTELHNPAYATKGSFESLHLGLLAVGAPCLLLESDIIYEPRAVDVALHSKHENVVLISGPTGSSDEVYVWANGEGNVLRFDAMSKLKKFRDREPSGELVGIHKIGLNYRRELIAAADALSPTDDYENGINIAKQQVSVHCELVSDLIWVEIDNEEMLSRVNRDIAPRLRSQEENAD